MIKQRFVVARHEAIPVTIDMLAESRGDCFVVPPRNDAIIKLFYKIN